MWAKCDLKVLSSSIITAQLCIHHTPQPASCYSLARFRLEIPTGYELQQVRLVQLSFTYVGLLHTIAVSNEHCLLVYTLHLKCFPIKGEPRPVENISYKGYSPPKCTCNGHVTHIHIPSKNMQFLLWNPTCHAMK